MSQVIENTLNVGADNPASAVRLDGVVIGLLTGFSLAGQPLVVFAANPRSEAMPARATVHLGGDDIGGEVALLFENGDPQHPLVIGRVQRPQTVIDTAETEPKTVEIDGERLVFNANREIVLRCGKASITLTKAGKVIIRGAYVLTRSSGVNRIKGGSVQIN